ncbi:metal-sulfur cluster assembly factor [Sediminibacterium salmoneum]|uniref:metal-sulfur cluster assembly factor n=1 Tax=Sediminibacterium salmoneum TaxID=426421 RepID=UPI0006855EA5|nr:metal-sulfur cluster assembly factor [Sediminibacterium salmoneum]
MNIITNNTAICADAIAILRKVEDPEIGLNIIDLGLVYQIDFDVAIKKIFCTMTLTTQFCPMGDSILNTVKFTLEKFFLDYSAEVYLTFEPSWNSDRISEVGKMYLNKK